VTQGDFVVMVLATIMPEQERQFLNTVATCFRSIRIHKLPAAGAFESEGEGEADNDPATTSRNVYFNGTRLDDQTLVALQSKVGIQLPDGNFWYDVKSGAAGDMGGPAVVFFPAGLQFCGTLPTMASGGGTSVMVNGRILSPADLMNIQSFCGPVQAGSYWLEGQGNYGVAGYGKAGNIFDLAVAYAIQNNMPRHPQYHPQESQQTQQTQNDPCGGNEPLRLLLRRLEHDLQALPVSERWYLGHGRSVLRVERASSFGSSVSVQTKMGLCSSERGPVFRVESYERICARSLRSPDRNPP
jgi:hypothetical protein